MWSFGSSHTDVWSAVVAHHARSLTRLEERIRSLIPTPSPAIPSSPGAESHASSASTILASSSCLIIWDSALGRAPFSDLQIVTKLAFAPLASHLLFPRSDADIIALQQLALQSAPEKVLKKLIVCSATSISNLDLSTLVSCFRRDLSGNPIALINRIESVDCIVGEIPEHCPNEVKERARRKIAPLTDTPMGAITFHHLNVMCTPVLHHYMEFQVDGSVVNLGVSDTNLLTSTPATQPLTRPPPNQNRAAFKCDYDSLPIPTKTKYEALARTFSDFALELGVRLEAWSLGPTSQLVAQQLAQLISHNDSSTTGEKVSLIIVDRNLDLLPSSSFASTSLLDRYQSRVDLSKLAPDYNLSKEKSQHVAYGLQQENPLTTRFCSTDPSAHDAVLNLLLLPPRECLSQLMRKLSELALEEQVEIDFSSPGVEGAKKAVSALVKALSVSPSGRSKIYKHRTLFSAVELACEMQDEVLGRTKPHATLFATIKHIMSSPGDANMHYIKDYLHECQNLPIAATLRSAMALTILTTLVTPPISSESDTSKEKDNTERRRKVQEEDKSCLEAIKTILAERLNKDPLPSSLEPNWLNDVDYSDKIQLMERLGAMFAFLLQSPEIEFEDFYTFKERPKEPCLLAQLVSRVFDPSHPELRDVKLSTLSIGGILKSGLSFVNLRHQQRPDDRNTVILYVLGGITLQEIHQTMQMFKKQNSKCQLLLASSHVISPWTLADMYCS